MGFERVGGQKVYDGKLVEVHVDQFRFDDDGEVAEREIVRHRGAVGIVVHDGDELWLVAQPREAVDEQSLLEIPAGRLDKEGEQPLETAKRELAEEIGKQAEHWEHLKTYYTGAGFTDERVHVYLASGLSDAQADSGENERIEIVKRPLSEIDAVIEEVEDAKTLIGLLLLRSRLQSKD